MSKIISAIVAILDSTPFQIFFAVWTGVYLVQVVKRDQGGPGTTEIFWIVLGFAVALFLV